MAVPYTFGSATTSIPLSQLDSNFATGITLGNTAIQLGNTVTTLNNMTLGNVTISSGTSNIQTNVANVTGVLIEANGGTGTTTGYYGFKNRIINGSMAIWQRGTSFTGGGSITYTADRWCNIAYAGSTPTISQVTSTGLTGAKYALRVQRPNGNSNTASLNISSSLESVNVLDLAGSTVTLSFYARVGANYSAASSYIACYIDTGTGTDQNVYGTYTGQVTTSQNNVGTTSWVKYTMTATVPSNATEIAVRFDNNGCVGTAGAADYYDIALVQLEKGSTATSFDYRPYTTELQLCYRYYLRHTNNRYQTSSTTTGSNVCAIVYYPVTMRTAPTFTTQLTNANYNSNPAVDPGWDFTNPFQLDITKTGTYTVGFESPTNISGVITWYGATLASIPTGMNIRSLYTDFSAEL